MIIEEEIAIGVGVLQADGRGGGGGGRGGAGGGLHGGPVLVAAVGPHANVRGPAPRAPLHHVLVQNALDQIEPVL